MQLYFYYGNQLVDCCNRQVYSAIKWFIDTPESILFKNQKTKKVIYINKLVHSINKLVNCISKLVDWWLIHFSTHSKPHHYQFIDCHNALHIKMS